uniref:Uncharacterized protein n=1 Tax=Glossina pallidipes TaxID=7398 RepID=A0A1A9ZCG9_GLOPL
MVEKLKAKNCKDWTLETHSAVEEIEKLNQQFPNVLVTLKEKFNLRDVYLPSNVKLDPRERPKEQSAGGSAQKKLPYTTHARASSRKADTGEKSLGITDPLRRPPGGDCGTVSELYQRIVSNGAWIADMTNKTVLWICGKKIMQIAPINNKQCYVGAKLFAAQLEASELRTDSRRITDRNKLVWQSGVVNIVAEEEKSCKELSLIFT